MSRLDLDRIQAQLKVAIQSHQVVVHISKLVLLDPVPVVRVIIDSLRRRDCTVRCILQPVSDYYTRLANRHCQCRPTMSMAMHMNLDNNLALCLWLCLWCLSDHIILYFR